MSIRRLLLSMTQLSRLRSQIIDSSWALDTSLAVKVVRSETRRYEKFAKTKFKSKAASAGERSKKLVSIEKVFGTARIPSIWFISHDFRHADTWSWGRSESDWWTELGHRVKLHLTRETKTTNESCKCDEPSRSLSGRKRFAEAFYYAKNDPAAHLHLNWRFTRWKLIFWNARGSEKKFINNTSNESKFSLTASSATHRLSALRHFSVRYY